MDQITFERPLTTENKAIRYATGINLIFVLAIILVILFDPTAKWGILFILALLPILLNLGLGFFLYRRYQENPLVKQKTRALDQFRKEEVKLAEIESKIDDFERRRTEINNDEINQLKIKQSNHDNFVRYIENRLHMSDTDHRRRLSVALADFQEHHIESGLKNHLISSANIPTLDTKMLERLSKKGILNANEIRVERLSKVRGLGKVEMESLLTWRTRVENELEQSKPTELTPEMQSEIEAKSQERQKELEDRITHLNETLETDLAEIQAAAAKDREENERGNSENLVEKEQALIALKSAQDQLNHYQDITPLGYIKNLVSLDGGLPKKSAQWLSLGTGLILILSCLFVGIYGAMSSSQVAVAMLITDTPTITLTPTASTTPTITLTPTSSPTETPTVTNTPTDTLTPSDTPSPSATLTLEISLTPSDTPIPSVTLPEFDALGCIPAENERVVGVVTRIIDGDTIVVTYDGQDHTIRYLGINAPASDAPYGEYAISENIKIALWETVTLVMDTTDMDGENRLLRYVIAGDKFINLELLKLGAAVVNVADPDVSCASIFETAQSEAQEADLGLWILTPSP